MGNLISRIGISAVVLVGFACILIAEVASADVKANCNRNDNHIRFKWRFPCSGETGQEHATTHGDPPADVCLAHQAQDSQDPNNTAVGFGCCINGEQTDVFVVTSGCSEAGGGMAQSVTYQPWASVGITNDGAPPPDPIPADSKLRFRVERTTTPGPAPDILTITFLGGGLQTRTVSANDRANSTLKLFVYPNQAAADADSAALTGAGSAFSGQVTLVGATGSVTPVYAFTQDDLLLHDDGGGQFTARFVPGLVKTALVPDADQAIVSVVADPQSGPAAVTGVGTDTRSGVWLGPAVPNPARGDMRIRFAIPRASSVTFGIYDPQGRSVRNLISGALAAGEHEARWDGRDAAGRKVPSSLYFYRLEADGRRVTGKVFTLR